MTQVGLSPAIHRIPAVRDSLSAMSHMRDQMRAGQLYRADDPQLQADHRRCQLLLEQYNATSVEDEDRRRNLLGQLLGTCGAGVIIKPTLRCDYGQYIHIGEGTFINYDAVLLDVQTISIGRFCQFGPRVQILTASHPVDPAPRRAGWEAGDAVVIGNNVWLGAGVIVLPGVTIGDDSVIGAGSVVTRDVPAGVVALGTPARPVRAVT